MLTVMGIDLGLSGAIATITVNPHVIHRIDDMPIVAKQICPYLLTSLFRKHVKEIGVTHIVIENVHAMPNQGVSSMFKFGRTKGAVEGALAALGRRYDLIEPRAWKSKMDLIKKPKNASRDLATKLFGSDQHWPLKKHDGRAEAALIALTKGLEYDQ